MEITTLVLERAVYPAWHCTFCDQKMQQRGTLPGASVFDKISVLFRELRGGGQSALALLPAAMPGSWMVNNQVTSPLFQAWLQPAHQGTWEELLHALGGDAKAWSTTSSADKERVGALVSALLQVAPGVGVVGLSKVLALLCSELVPLMDNAALWFALDAVSYPKNATEATLKAEFFVPMLDWFAKTTLAHEASLAAIAETHAAGGALSYSPAQVLDRLLWFESWGYHIFPQSPFWRWLADGEHQAIVPLGEPPPHAHNPPAMLDLQSLPQDDWREAASELLQDLIGPAA